MRKKRTAKKAVAQKLPHRLETLLEKKRSREKAEQVEKVLGADLSPEEKILLIDSIDDEKKTVELSELEDKKNLAYLLKKENILTAEEARRLRKNVKRTFTRTSLWEYLFFEYRSLSAFCQGSSFIRAQLIPPRVEFDRHIVNTFFNRIQNEAGELVSSLHLILSLAWQHSTKMEYNLLVQLERLCNRIVHFNVHLLDLRRGKILEHISGLEKDYILCHYKRHYPEMIVAKVKEVIRLHPEFSMKSSRIVTLILSLLEMPASSASLGEFIVAANSAWSRRMLHFNDIVFDEYPVVISNFDFECSDEVKKNIDAAKEKLLREMARVLHEKQEMDHLSSYIAVTDEGNFDFTILEKFYNYSASLHGGSFDTDSENMLLFVIRFYDGFFASCMELLTGTCQCGEGRKRRIFSAAYFQLEMEKMYLLQQRLAKYPYSIKEFPRTDFSRLVKKPGNESGPRREAAGITRELMEHLSSVVKKLMHLLRGHSDDYAAFVAGDPRPVSEEMVQQGHIAIPYYRETLQGEIYFSGMTVREALTELVSVCLLFTRFVRDERVDLFVSSFERVNHELGVCQNSLRRLATVEEFQKYRDMYGF